MKMKTYVLTLSRTFPKGHPREGQETEFAYSFMKALYAEEHRDDDLHADYPKPHKIHAIRADYELWKRRIDEVRAGRAVLSVREWTGLPIRSKQRELFSLDRDSGVGIQKLEICTSARNWTVYHHVHINGKPTEYDLETLAANDGLSLPDWRWWFNNGGYDWSKPMAVIHFTGLRY